MDTEFPRATPNLLASLAVSHMEMEFWTYRYHWLVAHYPKN